MVQLEVLTLWAAIGAYALAAVLVIIGVAFDRPRLVTASLIAAAVGLASHAIALGARWARVGHGPSLGYFEVASGLVFVGVAAFLLLAWRYRGLSAAGVVVMPFAFLALGSTLLVDPAAREASGALASAWLLLHVVFANLAFAAYAGALVLAIGTLLSGSSAAHRLSTVLRRMPDEPRTAELTVRFARAGFVLQGVMIVSGAIWANEAWGRYWAFDPIEVWSLIAWLIMALYLHLTLTLGWRSARSAWVIVIAFAALAFSLLGVPAAYDSIHGAYLSLA